MIYELPTYADIDGVRYFVRSDFRATLDIIEILNDADLTDDQRTLIALEIMFEHFDEMPQSAYQEAVSFLEWFIAGGDDEPSGKKPKLVDWGHDFKRIVQPVNRILGYEVRSCDYMHWWTFLGAFFEIGDCHFAHVVDIRNKRAKGRKLDKTDRQFYRENRSAVDFPAPRLSKDEQAALDEWLV